MSQDSNPASKNSSSEATTQPLDGASPLSSLAAALKAESSAQQEAAASADAASSSPGASNQQPQGDDDEEEEEEGPPVNPLSDDDSDDDTEVSKGSDVQLGFLEEALHPNAMLRHYFPCKVGGKPAWLNPQHLPTNAQLTCVHCKNPLIFLLQLYAPLRSTHGAHVGSFHRTLYLFCCMETACTNKQQSIVCMRSQLPRVNPYYPDVAPPKLEEFPLKAKESLPVYEDKPFEGVHLCAVCGNPAPSSCSRCHTRRYCSKLHQLYDWKNGHKQICAPATPANDSSSSSSSSASSSTTTAPPPPPSVPFLFPQKEVVIEPEEFDEEEEEETNHQDKKDKGKKGTDFTKEKKLLDEYEKQKAADAAAGEEEEDEEEIASAASSWASPKLKDPLFLKFKTKIAENPDQVLRYDRAAGSENSTTPLWVSNWFQPASPPLPEAKVDKKGKKLPIPPIAPPTFEENQARIPPCETCGKQRRFEFQVLPQILYYLGSHTSLDFANLVVYTCENSCGDGEKGYMPEFVWVQAHAQ